MATRKVKTKPPPGDPALRTQRVHLELPYSVYERVKIACILLTKRRGYRVPIRDIAIPAIEQYLNGLKKQQ